MKKTFFFAPIPPGMGLSVLHLALLFSLFFFALLPGRGLGQTAADSAAVIRQVDSLLEVSQRLSDEGDLSEAIEVGAFAVNLALEKTGRESLLYEKCSSTLGWLYLYIGAYDKAEKWYLESKAVREKIYGKEHVSYCGGLINLASVYNDKGDFEKSERLLLEAKEIFEVGLKNTSHDFYRRCLNSLAIMYGYMGNYERAEPLFLECKTFVEKYIGKESSEYGRSLNNLASTYIGLKQYAKAEPMLLESVAIRKKALGAEHPDYAESVFNLAGLYQNTGRYDEAEPLYLEVLSIEAKARGKEQPRYIYGVLNIGTLYLEMDKPEKAESFLLEAKASAEKVFGQQHPDYSLCLSGLLSAYQVQAAYGKAAPIMEQLSDLDKLLLIRALRFMSSEELQHYVKLFITRQGEILSCAQNDPGSQSAQICFDNSLFFKGFLLQAANRIRRLALDNPVAADQLGLLKTCEKGLSEEYAMPVAERDSAKVSQLEIQANALEKDLARNVAGYGEAMRQVNWQEVQQNLKPGEAAIEFVHYRFYYKKNTDSTYYAALVLRPGWTAPRMVRLFEQRDIQPLLAAANTAAAAGQLYASRGSKKGKKPTRGGKGEGIVIPGPKTAGLYQLIWAKMDSLLSGATTVYYAPSGLLHRLNPGAIAVPGTDQTLADRYHLVQLGSTRSLAIGTKARQLVVNDRVYVGAAHTATLFGGLRYEAQAPAAAPDSMQQTSPAYDIAALRSALGGPGGEAWNYLPGTEKEVKNAAAMLGKAGYSVRTLGGSDGTEAAFKMLGSGQTPAPTVLHIATHGFFFPDPKTEANTAHEEGAVFKTADNPLLRSGLVLAGANPAWAGSKTPPGQEDGILTAYEISQLNLGGTELVVLSACETGLGDVEDNEGVYGLKRAFKIAGVKYLVMSLWQVPDQQTQELMSAFYKNWLERQMPVPAAFAAAQRAMRERYEDPFFWAGFVLVE